MRNKNLLFLLLSRSYGGLEIHSLDFCNWMRGRGWDIRLLCAYGSKVMQESQKRELNVYSIQKPKKYFDLTKIGRAIKILNKLKPDVLFVSDNNDLNFAVLLKKFSRQKFKLIYILHMQIGVNKKDLYHRFIFSNVDKWVVPLEYLKFQTLQKTSISESKIVIINHGSDIIKLKKSHISKSEARKIFGVPDNVFVIGMNARIDAQKNQHFVVEALSQIISDYNKKIYFIILGRPTINEGLNYYDYLLNLIKEKQLEQYVILKDYIEDISFFYKAIDSLIVATKVETYGQNTIEAIISGVPVIGTNTGGTKEILEKIIPDLLFEPLRLDDFVKKLLMLMEKYEFYRNEILKINEEFSKTFSNEEECKKYEKLIEEL